MLGRKIGEGGYGTVYRAQLAGQPDEVSRMGQPSGLGSETCQPKAKTASLLSTSVEASRTKSVFLFNRESMNVCQCAQILANSVIFEPDEEGCI